MVGNYRLNRTRVTRQGHRDVSLTQHWNVTAVGCPQRIVRLLEPRLMYIPGRENRRFRSAVYKALHPLCTNRQFQIRARGVFPPWSYRSICLKWSIVCRSCYVTCRLILPVLLSRWTCPVSFRTVPTPMIWLATVEATGRIVLWRWPLLWRRTCRLVCRRDHSIWN